MPRKPKPTHLKAVTGTTRGKATQATQARLSGTMPPAFVSDRAREHWPELADLLTDMNVITDGDKIALGLLCETLAEWIEARDTVAAQGATYEATTEAGAVMYRAHPAVAQRNDAARRVQSLLSEFGLTPSARAKVQGLPDLPGDDAAKEYFK
ncbi:phage terminase small subunit P27 family [Lutimaribacter sp. EGI FJ00015]|uniref:Phage terminase small subunit P27 family n=1 Tax=Lutimaribacter degradans TaxID=2945989 RepID=A0ACC5ZSP5_9RHOB|nr:phage terminase small subunit P27 family [Lutimaribacter sp. EGI FJ00013]MCM2561349.1 phage terminase small subunit P27 family [Lutimaribacter sp. EGI FJ00013]MCO0611700.1 phage terminase small subunit P27 family [Lutimaribacter sp. EGI FJ00015]MCO0635178.1 phage terminase small subunit P27 family [Lutimaribacter sp. EGI FJ00014]